MVQDKNNLADGRKHILIAHFRQDIVSGAEISIAEMVDQLLEQFRFTMLVPGEGKLAQTYRQRGYSTWVKKVQTRRRLFPGLHTIQSFLFAREMQHRGVDGVVCNTFPAASRVQTACRLAKIPYAIYVREYITDRPIHRQILRAADQIFTVSQDLKAYLETLAEPAKILLARDYINGELVINRAAAHLASDIRLVPFSPEHPLAGMVGRITAYKNQDLFVRTIPFVLQAIPEARFVIVGTAKKNEKWYEEKVWRLAEKLGVQDKVVFMGLRTDAIEITSEFSVACMVSSREPMARVVMEAQILGVPVVASDRGGSPEIVEHEVTGLLFSPDLNNSEERLAEQIIRVLRDESFSKQIAERAKVRVHETYTGSKHVNEFARLLHQLFD